MTVRYATEAFSTAFGSDVVCLGAVGEKKVSNNAFSPWGRVRYAESSQGLQRLGSMFGTLLKSEKPLDMGEPTFHAEKTACC